MTPVLEERSPPSVAALAWEAEEAKKDDEDSLARSAAEAFPSPETPTKESAFVRQLTPLGISSTEAIDAHEVMDLQTRRSGGPSLFRGGAGGLNAVPAFKGIWPPQQPRSSATTACGTPTSTSSWAATNDCEETSLPGSPRLEWVDPPRPEDLEDLDAAGETSPVGELIKGFACGEEEFFAEYRVAEAGHGLMPPKPFTGETPRTARSAAIHQRDIAAVEAIARSMRATPQGCQGIGSARRIKKVQREMLDSGMLTPHDSILGDDHQSSCTIC